MISMLHDNTGPFSNQIATISFCTTCMGRGEFLLETLRKNLDITCHEKNIEFVVLAYGDPEIAREIKEQFSEEIRNGRLKLASIDAQYWSYSHAKNVAHRMATGDILVNVDADNILGERFVHELRRIWTGAHIGKIDENVVMRAIKANSFEPIRSGGGGGRVAISRSLFNRIGGYDETFSHWGGEDRDLVARAVVAGARFVRIPERIFGDFLPHSHDLRLKHQSPEDRRRSEEALEVSDEIWTRIAEAAEREETYINHEALEELTSPRPGLKPVANMDPETSKLHFGCGEVSLTKWNYETKEFEERPVSLSPLSLASLQSAQMMRW